METKQIKINLIDQNTGQIKGLPKNPRFIRNKRFEHLKKSISDAPEMLFLREIIVIEHNCRYVSVCGNMRLRACVELGYNEIPCKILPPDTPVEKLREYAIKDNVSFGDDDWDALANEWNEKELGDYGMEYGIEIDDFMEDMTYDEVDEKAKITISIPKRLKYNLSDIRAIVQKITQNYDSIKIK